MSRTASIALFALLLNAVNLSANLGGAGMGDMSTLDAVVEPTKEAPPLAASIEEPPRDNTTPKEKKKEPVIAHDETDEKKAEKPESKGPARLIQTVVTHLDDFEEFLGNNENAVVKFFQSAEIDPPSQEMIPIDEEIYKAYSEQIAFININGKEHPEISRTYGITQTPTYLFFKKGYELAKQTADGKYEPLRLIESVDKTTLEAHIIKLLQTPAPISDSELEQELDKELDTIEQDEVPASPSA
jgi:thioredoxin-like negative regulator of GroEL